jgi:hypothetical protein
LTFSGYTLGTNYTISYLNSSNTVVDVPVVGGSTIYRIFSQPASPTRIINDLPKAIPFSYLIVGGGGNGGNGGNYGPIFQYKSIGGGGGGGGVLTGTSTFSSLTSYETFVGDSAQNSFIQSPPGFLTALGGGNGGANGGSGGGGAVVIEGFGSNGYAGGLATEPSQGGNGGAGIALSNIAGGGGGGFPQNGSSEGNGGNGRTSNITGRNVTYGGGGGAGGRGLRGNGGTGGGGQGGDGINSPTPGEAATGGGGGGAGLNTSPQLPYHATFGAAGGSGVIIIRIPSFYTYTSS